MYGDGLHATTSCFICSKHAKNRPHTRAFNISPHVFFSIVFKCFLVRILNNSARTNVYYNMQDTRRNLTSAFTTTAVAFVFVSLPNISRVTQDWAGVPK